MSLPNHLAAQAPAHLKRAVPWCKSGSMYPDAVLSALHRSQSPPASQNTAPGEMSTIRFDTSSVVQGKTVMLSLKASEITLLVFLFFFCIAKLFVFFGGENGKDEVSKVK